MIKLMVLCLSFSSFLFAAEKKYILKIKVPKAGVKQLYLDFNQDEKVDAVETYIEKELSAVERDSKYSGRMDEWITYFPYVSPVKPIEILKKDTNGDGKVDRVESSYSDPAHNKFIITTEVDTKLNGTFDKKWTTTSKLRQEKDRSRPCDEAIKIDNPLIDKLSKEITSAQGQLNDGYITNEMGYKIHQSCLENWGAKEFTSLMNTTMTKGFQCLERLANENDKKNPAAPNGAKKNLAGLNHLLQTSGISVVCGEKSDYRWKGTAGHASTTPSENLSDPKASHPFVSINPNDPKEKRMGTKGEIAELSKTLFHEQLHNLGIRHNEKSIEYPYTCETCCMPSDDDKKEAIDISCKICSGVYAGNMDPNYLKDMITWAQSTYNLSRAQKAVIGYQLENPQSRFGLFAYADASAGIFSPVGIEMAKILKEKFPVQTDEEKASLERSLMYQTSEEVVKYSSYAKLVAETHIDLYYEQNENKVLSHLEKQKEFLKEIVKKKSTAQGDDKYIIEDVAKQMEDMLSSIWMKGYPDSQSPESTRAYNLLKETGFF